MLPTLITGTFGPVSIYKNRLVPIRSTVHWMWSGIITKISSNSDKGLMPLEFLKSSGVFFVSVKALGSPGI